MIPDDAPLRELELEVLTSLFTPDELVELRRLVRRAQFDNNYHVEFRTRHPDCNPQATVETLALDSLLTKLAELT